MKSSSSYILHAIMRGLWLIEPITAASYYPRIKSFFEKGTLEEERDSEGHVKIFEPVFYAAHLAGNNVMFADYKSYDEVPEGSLAVHYVQGSLMKHDFCGEPGTKTIGALIQAADAHSNISGHLAIHDSPGGTADGTETFANTIGNTKKPLLGFVDGMSASASYWALSKSNHIMLSGQSSEVGSIGTMFGMKDFRGVWKEMGVNFHDVVASQSPDKNKAYFDLLDGKYDAIKKEMLDPLTEVFHNSVKGSRKDLKADAITGKMFFGQTAIDLGLADSIGSFEDAVRKLESMISESRSDKSSKNSNSNTMFTSKLDKAVNTLAAKVKKGDDIHKEDVVPVNQELENLGLTGFVIATRSGLDQMNNRVEELENEVSTLTAEKEALGKGAGADPSEKETTPKNKDGGDDTTLEQSEEKQFMSYDHNIEAINEIKNL